MAYTTTLSAGRAHVIEQNVVYAMPPYRVRVHSLHAVDISPDGSTWDALTNAETVGADAASAFIRTQQAGGTTVVIKRS